MKQLFAAAAMLLASPVCAEDAIEFPGVKPLRVEVTIDGKAPDVAWAAFLDKLFDHFDRDSDGVLAKEEAGRIFPLPLTDGRVAKPAAGKVSREAFREHYRKSGFTPVAIRIAKSPVVAMKLGDAVVRLLDRDSDGKLSDEELKRVPDLLKRCDGNEDEVLTAAELLESIAAKPLPAAGIKLADAPKNGPVLHLPIGGKALLSDRWKSFQIVTDGSRFTFPGGVCSVHSSTAPSLRGTREFYLAQFQSIAGNKPAVKSAFEDDPTAQVLAGLFDSADRDADARLTVKELDDFFDLIEAGIRCRVSVELMDRGRNLFDRIDSNGDGSLDAAELNRAANELPGAIAKGIPASFRLTVSRGVSGSTFGPVPIGGAANPKAVAKAQAPGGPRWFTAMDRNGDGFVSVAEFLGPPSLFARLDRDRDRRLSQEEAKSADKP